jgi:hypothetical protein
MIALSPIASWLLLGTLAAAAVVFAVSVARMLDAADDRRSMADWRRMCDALELYDWAEEEDDD